MPVFEQSYPSWSPSQGSRLRWWPILRRELQMLVSQRPFKIMLFACTLPCLIHLLQIYSVNKLAVDPSHELARAFRNIDIQIDAEFFLGFLLMQSYSVFVLLLYASSGLVCDDVRLNLAEVYFSKPLTVRDYVVGKVATVVGLGLAYTALPALFLFAAQLIMAPDMDYLRENAWVPVACVAFSVALVVPMALGALACSAMTSSRRYAAATAITLLAANGFLAGMLASILNMRSVQLLAIPEAMAWLGTALFTPDVRLPMPLPVIALIVASVALIGFAVLWRRVKRVEVGL